MPLSGWQNGLKAKSPAHKYDAIASVSYILTNMKVMIHLSYNEGDYQFMVYYFLSRHNKMHIKYKSRKHRVL